MAGQKGRDVLIKIGDGGAPESFTTIAGIRTKTIALSAGNVDGTNADSPDAWRELIAGAGVKSASVSGSGVFKDQASDARLRAAFFNQEAANYELLIPDFGVLSGAFLITELNYAGEHDGEASFSISLASAGQIVFAAL